jgi:ferric enterobactin receptor
MVHAAEVNQSNWLNKIQTKMIKNWKIVLTAEEQIKQSLGVSKITAEDLEKIPVRNDISEYVRRMPGVNLTGNSATGQRGNNRQIDIRGMGPENTLILIDGKPVFT